MIRSRNIGGFLNRLRIPRMVLKRWFPSVVLLLVATILAGCGGAPPSTSWPGYVVRGDKAYVASSDQILELDVTSNIADVKRQGWKWPTGNSSAGVGYHSQPALSPDGKTLYFGADSLTGNSGAVFALDIDLVTLKWTYPLTNTDVLPGNIYGGVVLADDSLYFAGNNGLLFALNAATGRPRWNQPFDPGTKTRIWSMPAVKGSTVFIASQDHHLYAVSTKDGRLIWRFPKDGQPEIGTLAGSPIVHGDTVYVASFDSNLYAITLSGELKWKFTAEGRLWEGPAEANSVLYQGDLNGNVYALDPDTGLATGWPQPAKLAGGIRATPLVTDSVIYVGTDQNKLYALETETGRPVWQTPFTAREGEMLLVTPQLSGDTLVVLPNLAGADPVRLYGINQTTGAQVWRFPPASTQ
jgi:outer membrane protein assembly factor BamB